MERDHDKALAEFLAAVDKRLETAPLVERREPTERRAGPGEKPVDGRRTQGPVTDAFAYWNSADKPTD
jgi:hypothetical protein